MSPGDRAVLYVTRGAFHNPTRDESRLRGIATVTGPPRQEEPPLEIADREFPLSCRVAFDTLLPERTGPAVRDLAPKLSLVKKPEAWGNYFRSSPIRMTEDDFRLLERTVLDAAD